MRELIKKENQTGEVIYAESINLYHEKISFQFEKASAVFFVTTQPFYEKYYEKLITLLDEKQSFEWYICPNNETISYLDTFNDVITFLEKTNLPTNTLIIGAGNHHIYHLCAFLKEMSLYLNRYIYFSTTLKGFSEALSTNAFLSCNQPFCLGTKINVLPNIIVYDWVLHGLENAACQSHDIETLIQLAVSSNNELFNLLTKISPTNQNINLTAYLEQVIESQQNNIMDIRVYVMSFAKSFYQLKESHYLSRNQKEHMAFLLYFLLCIEENDIHFDFSSFLLWYEKMIRLKLDIPIQMNTYDLAECLLAELNRFTKLIGIQSIGKLNEMSVPSLDELFRVIERYKKIKEERGEIYVKQ